MNSCIYKTPFGNIRLIAEKGYLVRVSFVERIMKSDMSIEHVHQPESHILRKACEELGNYFSGSLKYFNIPINVQGTIFQRLAWSSLLKIPYGETMSYFQQAKSTKNPIPIIIPCHRVIRKNGNFGGYTGGMSWKNYLIEHEKKFKSVRMN